MKTLHLFNESPFSTTTLSNTLSLIQPDDAILLMGDAVYVLQKNLSLLEQLMNTSAHLYALKEDTLARGLEIDSQSIELIDYSAFVTLCIDHNKVVSWS